MGHSNNSKSGVERHGFVRGVSMQKGSLEPWIPLPLKESNYGHCWVLQAEQQVHAEHPSRNWFPKLGCIIHYISNYRGTAVPAPCAREELQAQKGHLECKHPGQEFCIINWSRYTHYYLHHVTPSATSQDSLDLLSTSTSHTTDLGNLSRSRELQEHFSKKSFTPLKTI